MSDESNTNFQLPVILGVATPLAETMRQWSSWRDDIPAILDDYLLGALLLWGAWSVGRNPRQGRAILACAWGFTCGIGYTSFFEQIRRSRLGEIDPSSLPSEWIVAIKGVGIAIAQIGWERGVRSKRSPFKVRNHAFLNQFPIE